MNLFYEGGKTILFSWIVAVASTAGSLFFSDVMMLPPCVLCWYQRIFMYPLVFIIGIGFVRGGNGLKIYGLPLSLTGLAISVYHNLLYYNFIQDAIIPCTQGISCTSKQIEWFGFITIPLLSFFAFLMITVGLLFFNKKELSKWKLRI